MKLCKDCKHYEDSSGSRGTQYTTVHLCLRRIRPHNMVTGEPRGSVNNNCIIEREAGWLYARLENLCGREARFFEPKEAKP